MKYDDEIAKLEGKIDKLKKKRDAERIKRYEPICEAVSEVFGEEIFEFKKKSELKDFLLSKLAKDTVSVKQTEINTIKNEDSN